MTMLNNAFYILNARIEQNRQDLKKILDESIYLNIDENEFYHAYGKLINSNKRISEEISYVFTEFNKEQLDIFIKFFSIIPNIDSFIVIVKDFDSLTVCNIVVEVISNMSLKSDVFIEWIVYLSTIIERINYLEVTELINEKRKISMFNKIETDIVISELEKHKKNCGRLIQNRLKLFSIDDLSFIMTEIVSKFINNDTNKIPYLISNLIDFYEIEIQNHLNIQNEKINNQIKRLNNALFFKEKNRNVVLTQTIDIIKNWDKFAQPIQLLRQVQSRKDKMSEDIFEIVCNNDVISNFRENNEYRFLVNYYDELEKIFAENDYIIKQIRKLKSIDSRMLFKSSF